MFYVKDLIFNRTLLCEKPLHSCIRNKSNILIEILELKEALKPHAELVREISLDFRPVDNKLHLKYLTWKSKKFYETLINDVSESPKYSTLKKWIMYKNMRLIARFISKYKICPERS